MKITNKILDKGLAALLAISTYSCAPNFAHLETRNPISPYQRQISSIEEVLTPFVPQEQVRKLVNNNKNLVIYLSDQKNCGLCQRDQDEIDAFKNRLEDSDQVTFLEIDNMLEENEKTKKLRSQFNVPRSTPYFLILSRDKKTVIGFFDSAPIEDGKMTEFMIYHIKEFIPSFEF